MADSWLGLADDVVSAARTTSGRILDGSATSGDRLHFFGHSEQTIRLVDKLTIRQRQPYISVPTLP